MPSPASPDGVILVLLRMELSPELRFRVKKSAQENEVTPMQSEEEDIHQYFLDRVGHFEELEGGSLENRISDDVAQWDKMNEKVISFTFH